jgi:hypothetical protein
MEETELKRFLLDIEEHFNLLVLEPFNDFFEGFDF